LRLNNRVKERQRKRKRERERRGDKEGEREKERERKGEEDSVGKKYPKQNLTKVTSASNTYHRKIHLAFTIASHRSYRCKAQTSLRVLVRNGVALG
jgi:hypothetical protein